MLRRLRIEAEDCLIILARSDKECVSDLNSKPEPPVLLKSSHQCRMSIEKELGQFQYYLGAG
jgi:hypothetical protein